MSKLDNVHPDPWQLVAELRAENEQAQDVIVKWMKANAAATTLINEQQRQIERLHTALQAVEWVKYGCGCPWCGNNELVGHQSDCQRQAALTFAQP